MSDFLGTQRAVLRSTRPTTEKIVLLAIIGQWSEASPDPRSSSAASAPRSSPCWPACVRSTGTTEAWLAGSPAKESSATPTARLDSPAFWRRAPDVRARRGRDALRTAFVVSHGGGATSSGWS